MAGKVIIMQEKGSIQSKIKYTLILLIVLFLTVIITIVFKMTTNKEQHLPTTKTKAADMTYKKVIDLSARDIQEKEDKGKIDELNKQKDEVETSKSEIVQNTTIEEDKKEIDVRTTPKVTEHINLSPTIEKTITVTPDEAISPTNALLADGSNKADPKDEKIPTNTVVKQFNTSELPEAGSIHIPLIIFIVSTMFIFLSFIL